VMLSELTDRTPRDRLGFAIGLVGTAGPLGLAVGPAFGGAVAETVGLPALFLLDAALTLGAALLLIVAYHERADRPRPTQRVLTLVRRSLVAAARTPVARAFFATYLLLLLGQRFLLPYLALYIEQLHGPRDLALLAGLVAAGYGLAAAVGSPIVSGLADRAGHRRMLLAALVATVAAMVAAGFAPGLLPFAVIYAAFGVGIAAASAILFTLLARGLEPAVRAPVLNLALVPLYVSGVIGGLASAGVIAAFGGDLRPVWLVSAVIAALALVPAGWFPRAAETATERASAWSR
jgi:MFS transporter, DHA1 family, multidrug resistance protein